MNTAKAPLNAVLPVDELRNDVQQPELARVDLGSYCGHLVEKTDSGFRPLGIAAYPALAPPQISTAVTDPISYYSLIDNGGTANLNAAGGPWAGDSALVARIGLK